MPDNDLASLHVKRCSRCKRELPASEFGFDRLRKDGRQPYCFECRHGIAREARDRRSSLRRSRDATQAHERYLQRKLKATCRVLGRQALRFGKIAGWPDRCEKCGRVGKVESHRPARQEGLEWFKLGFYCRSCHVTAHRRWE